jgi:PAS domain S-box-containing protein
MSTSAGKPRAHSKATQVFKGNEKLLLALFENSSDALALVSSEGIFLFVSPQVQKILGYTPHALVGQSTHDLFPPGYPEEIVEQFQSVAETPGLTVTVEHPYFHKDGSVRWIESTITNYLHDPTIQIYVANFRDISGRKHAAEQQRVLNQASNILTSSLDHQITLREIAELIVPTLADYCRIAILDDKQQIKEISVNHIDPEKISLVRALYEQYKDKTNTTHGLQRLLETGKSELISSVSGEILETVQDDVEMLVIINALGLQSYMGVPLIARGKTIGAITFSSVQHYRRYTQEDVLFAEELARRIALVLDISDQKELERRKDEFISMASHELRTPVTSLKGFTNLFQRRLAKQADEKALHYLARMDAQLNKLTKLITDLLDVSKILTGKVIYREEPFELDALLNETIENLQAATPTHRLRLDGTAEAQIYGDRDRIGQVLINLITNAIKYSPQADTVVIHIARDSQNAQVSVQDFGIGIGKEHQQKIFERFYQVTDPEEKTYPGLGIGLYLSYEIIRRHEGNMWVESKKGEGATFHFTLPLMERKRS